MAAGTRLVTRGANTMTSAVQAPTTIPCHCQSAGMVSDRHSEVPAGVPSSFGNWLPMMMSPTAER